MKYPCVESTLDITVGYYTARLWLDRGHELDAAALRPARAESWEVDGILREELALSPLDLRAVFERILAAVPRVNAVQILVQERDVKYGTVVYAVDFEDVRG